MKNKYVKTEIVMSVLLILDIIFILISSLLIKDEMLILISMIIGLIVLITDAIVLAYVYKNGYTYKCLYCGHTHKLKRYVDFIFSPHVIADFYIVCPNCKRRRIHEVIRKKEIE